MTNVHKMIPTVGIERSIRVFMNKATRGSRDCNQRKYVAKSFRKLKALPYSTFSFFYDVYIPDYNTDIMLRRLQR